jgi:hypothetical protein
MNTDQITTILGLLIAIVTAIAPDVPPEYKRWAPVILAALFAANGFFTNKINRS